VCQEESAGQSGRHHINRATRGSWLVWQAPCQHNSTWIMAILAGVTLTQQHMDHGQSGRHHVNTAAHGSWPVWQVCQHSSTWTMGSLAGIMLTQQHMDHLYTTSPGLQLLETLHNLGCGIFFQSR